MTGFAPADHGGVFLRIGRGIEFGHVALEGHGQGLKAIHQHGAVRRLQFREPVFGETGAIEALALDQTSPEVEQLGIQHPHRLRQWRTRIRLRRSQARIGRDLLSTTTLSEGEHHARQQKAENQSRPHQSSISTPVAMKANSYAGSVMAAMSSSDHPASCA